MVKYETTIVDLEASAGGVYQTTVAPVPVKSSRSWIWKTLAAIAFIALCAVAAVFFAWHVTKQNQTELPSYSEKQISTTTALPTQQGKMLKQIAERTKAAIHLHGEHSSSLPNDSLKWVSGVDQSFEQGGLKLDDNKILIPADGLYFVYSQVSYSIQCNPDEDELTQKFLSHSIWRYTDAVTDWKPLQNSAHSVCQSQEDGKTTYSTIYLGAVFKLMQGDKLSTKTSHAAEVEENYAKTFFGVFAL
ncbi:tumor necrosis factor b (TNF superfamily, member 2) [Labeo rohita]|uniref:tumor necrosis factor b (TNF superfamily, member 2) n=1 Tax=Labeo rohita TaxID=84645 RepID=UPI0021E1CB92|nr:tumor necrosis factor b (TNF superfamily, member 2) [Labeo rohita]